LAKSFFGESEALAARLLEDGIDADAYFGTVGWTLTITAIHGTCMLPRAACVFTTAFVLWGQVWRCMVTLLGLLTYDDDIALQVQSKTPIDAVLNAGECRFEADWCR